MSSTLTAAPVAPLLDRLYADAARSGQILGQMFGHLTREERLARMSDPNADYRAFFGKAREIHMPVSRATGALLYMLARGNGARAIVEFGTSFGLSTIHMAAALRDNGGSKLIGTEFEPNKLVHARANLQAAGLADLVDIREGDALQTLTRDLPDTVPISCCSTATNRSTTRSWRWSLRACAPDRTWSPTTPTPVPSTRPTFAPPIPATSRSRSARTSSSR